MSGQETLGHHLRFNNIRKVNRTTTTRAIVCSLGIKRNITPVRFLRKLNNLSVCYWVRVNTARTQHTWRISFLPEINTATR